MPPPPTKAFPTGGGVANDPLVSPAPVENLLDFFWELWPVWRFRASLFSLGQCHRVIYRIILKVVWCWVGSGLRKKRPRHVSLSESSNGFNCSDQLTVLRLCPSLFRTLTMPVSFLHPTSFAQRRCKSSSPTFRDRQGFLTSRLLVITDVQHTTIARRVSGPTLGMVLCWFLPQASWIGQNGQSGPPNDKYYFFAKMC